MQRRTIPLISLAAIVLTAIGTAACGSPSPPPSGTGQPSSSQPSSSQPGSSQATSPASTATPVSCPAGWRTGSHAVTRQVAVPPVPVATAIRTGSHPDCRFDRLVIDISGTVPGYSARFVTQVTQDGSGRPITMPGTRYLVITLTPADGHTANGTPTLPQHVQALSYPMLKSYALAGDFEGYLTVALGLSGGTRYRVDELPGRIYIDVAW